MRSSFRYVAALVFMHSARLRPAKPVRPRAAPCTSGVGSPNNFCMCIHTDMHLVAASGVLGSPSNSCINFSIRASVSHWERKRISEIGSQRKVSHATTNRFRGPTKPPRSPSSSSSSSYDSFSFLFHLFLSSHLKFLAVFFWTHAKTSRTWDTEKQMEIRKSKEAYSEQSWAGP